jgi:peptidoglycan DL-endopeptidase CwlO
VTGVRRIPDHRRTQPGRRQLATAAVCATLAIAATAATLPGAASAAPRTPSPVERARELRKTVAALELRAEKITEAYDAANAKLGTLVTRHLLAEQQLRDARAAEARLSASQAETARAVFRSGGSISLYATVFDGTDPTDLLDRLHSVETVLDNGDTASTAAATAGSRSKTIETHLAALTRAQTKLEVTISHDSSKIQSAISRSRALLAAADAEVRRLAAAQAAAIDAAAAAHAQQTLDAARAAAVPGGPGDVAAPDPGVVRRAIAEARAELGKPYQWGATGPGSFDCSGLTGWAYGHAGHPLPRTSREQWYAGPHPGLGYLQPGDLLFWATNPADPATIHHVALYIGNDMMIAAPHTGTDVQIQPVYLTGYIGAVRPTAA